MLIVKVGQQQVEIPTGSTLAFGRAPGPLTIGADDDRVSRQHGVIGSEATYWYVHSTSPHYGFVVYDCATPSRLHVPPGAGPLTIPFAAAILSIEILGARHHVQVQGVGCDNWGTNWGPHVRQRRPQIHGGESLVAEPHSGSGAPAVDAQAEPAPGMTRYVWDDLSLKAKDGKILQWYRALVAMCEPRLQTPPNDRIPTDAEIARRLGISPKTLEKHRDRLRDELGFSKYDEQMRLAAVVLSLGQGLVTAEDLRVLDLPGVD
jgi:hypothetical protein